MTSAPPPPPSLLHKIMYRKGGSLKEKKTFSLVFGLFRVIPFKRAKENTINLKFFRQKTNKSKFFFGRVGLERRKRPLHGRSSNQAPFSLHLSHSPRH